jgi:hypothetical protein
LKVFYACFNKTTQGVSKKKHVVTPADHPDGMLDIGDTSRGGDDERQVFIKDFAEALAAVRSLRKTKIAATADRVADQRAHQQGFNATGGLIFTDRLTIKRADSLSQ